MKNVNMIFLALFLLVLNNPTSACTGITASKGDTVLFGNNEDWNDPHTYVWYVPSEEGKYGGMYFGYGNFFPQGGMNVKGLCYDGFATPHYPVHNPDNKPVYYGMFLDKVMEECETIVEVVDMFQSYFIPWMADCQLFFVDRTGASVIIEGDSVVYKEGDYQVCTNFYQTNPQVGWWPCWRYNRAVDMLEDSDGPSVDLFRSILDACHQAGTYPTLYSNIFDLNQGIAYVYLNHEFKNALKIDLHKELELGAHVDYLPSLDGLDFFAEPSSGHGPLTIQFTDVSTAVPPIVSWAWDFNGDGVIDSDEQNPTWTCTEPGVYTASLEVSNGNFFYTRIHENSIRVFDGESALQFTGDNSYVSCPASSSLNLTNTVTIEAWINPAGWGNFPNFGLGKVIDKKNISLQLIDSYLSFHDHSLLLQLVHGDGTISYSNSPDSSIILNEWQQIVITYNGEDAVNMYINGVEQTVYHTTSPSGIIKDNSEYDLVIGNDATSGYTFDGIIDEVRIWDVVLTAEDISANMDHYLQGNEPGLICNWQMNEGYGETIEDFSGNGNEGTLHNATWHQGVHLNPPSADLDEDGVVNSEDNCPNDYNPGQEDVDGDSTGDVCDNCPEDFNLDQADADDDGSGDVCDSCTDSDDDGFGNPGYAANLCGEDNCPDVYNPDQAPVERGDIDCQSGINVQDILAVVNHILRTTPLIGAPLDRADCNSDGQINILDVVGIVNVILGILPECPESWCRPEVTPEVMQFLKELQSYLPADGFTRFMELVEVEIHLPAEYHLSQNYPNPFNTSTTIHYTIPVTEQRAQSGGTGVDSKLSALLTTLKVYNLLGQEVRTLVDEIQGPGYYAVTWDGSDMASGVYFCRMKVGNFSATRSVILMK